MNPITVVPVSLAGREYDITIGQGILEKGVVAARLVALNVNEPLVFITHPALEKKYVTPLVLQLEEQGIRSIVLTYPPGERLKTLAGMGKLYSGLASAGLDRKGAIVVVGGGVLGDMAGFAAATYLRGVRFVQIPTTLLAQVDASVGGKTAVDLPEGKNLVGAFHQPSAVLIDPATLGSLPMRELRSGLSEVVKYGIIWEEKFFERLRELRPLLLKKEPAALAEIIRVCCEIKAEVVRQDETEQSVRAILNFGHTIGHALESVTRYRVYKHGEAIAIGMVAEARLGERLGVTPKAVTKDLVALLTEFGLPTEFPPHLPPEAFFVAMRRDKKTLGGEFKFVLAERIGQVRYGQSVSEAVILELLFRD